MNVKIESTTKQPLFSRSLVKAGISFDTSTPSRIELRKAVAESLKADVKLVSIVNINTDFGQKTGTVLANVYEKKEDLERLEPKVMQKRHLTKEEKEKAKGVQ